MLWIGIGSLAQEWIGSCLVERGRLSVLAGMRRFGYGMWGVLWRVGYNSPRGIELGQEFIIMCLISYHNCRAYHKIR